MDKLKETVSGGKAAPIAILGVPFDNVGTAETIALIEQMVRSRRPHYLATANVDFLAQAARDVELRRILFDAHLVLCDGTPLVWASRLLGNPLPERVAGSDIVPLLLKVAAEKGYRPFFLGATPEAIEAAVKKVSEQYPALRLAGFYSPPFNRLLEMDHDEIRERILKSQPDLLFVGFGCPKQEKWINMHYRSLGVPVSIGVGGTIDFLAGKLSRAPRWMQVSGTEWIYRLGQEPRRLAGRYANDLWYFGGGLLAQLWRFRVRRPRRRREAEVAAAAPANLDFGYAVLPARLDFEEAIRCKPAFEALLAAPQFCVLDGGQVRFIDSTGVGLLIGLQKRARQQGSQLAIVRPSEELRHGLRMMRLEEFFTLRPDLAAARAHFEAGANPAVQLRTAGGMGLAALAWAGEITAANAEEIWTGTMAHIAARALAQRTLRIDLSGVRFIDSTGLGVMVRTRKYGARQGVKIAFDAPGENVRNVIRLSRLEDFLLKEPA